MIDDIAIGELPSEEDLLMCFHHSEDLFAQQPYNETSNPHPLNSDISNENYILTTFNNGSLGLIPKLRVPSLHGDVAGTNFVPAASSTRPRVLHGTRMVHHTNKNKIKSISQSK